MSVDQTSKHAYDIPVLPTPVGLKKERRNNRVRPGEDNARKG